MGSEDYKGYTINVYKNKGGKYTAKNDSGEPYSNVRQFNTPEEAIAWDKKNIDQMEESVQRSRMVEATNLPQYGFSNEFIRGIFGNANIPHDAEVEQTSKKPSTAMLDDYVVLVQAADGEYAYWRPSTRDKSYVRILRTQNDRTEVLDPDELETGKKIVRGTYFLIPIQGWNNRNRKGPGFRHDGTRPGDRKPHVKSDSIFPNDASVQDVMKHLKKVFYPRLQKKAENLVDRIYGALRYLDTKPHGHGYSFGGVKSAAQEALGYVDRINTVLEQAYGSRGPRRALAADGEDGLVSLLRLVSEYNKAHPKEDIQLYGISNYYTQDEEKAIALLQREPQMRFKVVQAVESVLENIEQRVQELIDRGRKKESVSRSSERINEGGYFGRNYYDSVQDVKNDMKKGWFGPDTAEEICDKFGWDTEWIFQEEDEYDEYEESVTNPIKEGRDPEMRDLVDEIISWAAQHGEASARRKFGISQKELSQLRRSQMNRPLPKDFKFPNQKSESVEKGTPRYAKALRLVDKAHSKVVKEASGYAEEDYIGDANEDFVDDRDVVSPRHKDESILRHPDVEPLRDYVDDDELIQLARDLMDGIAGEDDIKMILTSIHDAPPMAATDFVYSDLFF